MPNLFKDDTGGVTLHSAMFAVLAVGTGAFAVDIGRMTVLNDLRVIAVGQKTEDQNGEARAAKTATLEVSPKEAEMIAMLTDLGRLSLLLRSLARDGPAEDSPAAAKTFTLDSEVSVLLTRRPVATKS